MHLGLLKSRKCRAILFLFLFVIASRLIIILADGPQREWDSFGYQTFADLILEDDQWKRTADLTVPPSRAPTLNKDVTDNGVITTVRLIGYPMLIAIAKKIAPQMHEVLLSIVQSLFAAFAYCMMFHAALKIGVPTSLALLALMLFSISFSLHFDTTILSDSFFSNLIILIVSLLILFKTSERQIGAIQAILVGGLLLLLCLLRDTGIYLAFVIAIFVIAADMLKTRRPIRPLLIGILLIAPSIVTVEVYKSWNEHRTGKRFTTIMSVTLLRPLVSTELYGKAVFDQGTPIHTAFQQTLGKQTDIGPCKTQAPPNLLQVLTHNDNHALAHKCMSKLNAVLLNEFGSNNYQIQKVAKSHIAKLAMERPLDLISYMISEIWPMAPMSIVTLDQIALLVIHGEQRRSFSIPELMTSLKEDAHPIGPAVLLAFEIGGRLLSLILFFAYFLITPIALVFGGLRDRLSNAARRALCLHYIISLSLLAGYSVIHMEPRYFLAAQAFIILDTLFLLSVLLNRTPRSDPPYRHSRSH